MVYIQSNTERTFTNHFDAACAYYGAEDYALDCRLTSFEEVVSGKFDTMLRRGLFVGSTEFMQEVFKRAGKTDVKLPRNSNRKSEIITLGEARIRQRAGEKLFIKPVDIKLFTGLVLDDFEYESISKVPEDTLVMVYETFNSKIESEWRIYVQNHKLVDSRNYSGSVTINPDYSYVKSVIEENRSDFPIAYVIDIGILKSGENVVVEFNDMWAIGNYGVPNHIYFSMLNQRYFEIIKSI